MSKKTYKKRFVFLRHDETYTLTATALLNLYKEM